MSVYEKIINSEFKINALEAKELSEECENLSEKNSINTSIILSAIKGSRTIYYGVNQITRSEILELKRQGFCIIPHLGKTWLFGLIADINGYSVYW